MADISKIKISNVNYDINDAKCRAELEALIGSDTLAGDVDTIKEIQAFLANIDTDDPTLFNQLKAINDRIDAIEAVSGTVDDALSATSTNPVQNKVIKGALDNKANKSELTVTAVTGDTTKKTIQLKSGTSQTVVVEHQDISGKANASDVYTKTQTDTLLSGKQNTLTFDSTPTASSTKPVTSGGIKTYVDGKATITGITTSQDGTFTIALSDGNSYTVNLNHVHSQYVESSDLADVATSGSYNDLSNKPTIPTVDTTITQNSTNAAQSGAVYTALAGKQNTLTFDNAPTSGSNNPVKSGGVYTALAGKADTSTTYTKSEIDTKIGNIETILASI